MNVSPLGQVLTAMISPFDDYDALDLVPARKLALQLTRDGWNDGLVINGTTGESTTTSDSEKTDLVAAVVEAVAGNAKVIAGVGAADTRHSIRLATAAEAAGADGLLPGHTLLLKTDAGGRTATLLSRCRQYISAGHVVQHTQVYGDRS